MFGSNDLGKNRRGILHWGAAESGLQLGEIETRYRGCQLPAAKSGVLIVFIGTYLQGVPTFVQEDNAI